MIIQNELASIRTFTVVNEVDDVLYLFMRGVAVLVIHQSNHLEHVVYVCNMLFDRCEYAYQLFD